MRFLPFGLLLAFGCGSSAATGDDAPPADSGPHGDADPCADPNNCPGDTGTFVSSLKGADSNPGTKAMPFKTIGAGVAHAKMLGGDQAVFVAQGTYPEKVVLAQGVDLNGGYECNPASCTWSRDLARFESTIANQDFEGVLAGAGITPATLLGGFKIVGKDGAPTTPPGSAGISVVGGSPTLRGNKIVGGAVTAGGATGADRSIGISLRSTGPMAAVIENNDVVSGTSSGVSAAVALEAMGATRSLATVSANILRGGSGRRSVGVMAFGTAMGTVLVNNDITAGNSANGASNGIEATSTLTIDRNRINSDASAVGTCSQTPQWCAGIASASATLVITNNVIYGPKGNRTTGVLLTENEVPAGQVVLNANSINGGGIGGNPSGTTRTESAAVVVSIGQCNNCEFTGVVGRVRNNILDGGGNQNRYGVREDPPQGRSARVDLLEANDIWFVQGLPNRNDVLYRQVATGSTPIDIKSLVVLNQMTTPLSQKNKAEDPLIDGTFHILAGSPCINAGVATEAPSVDFDGDARPAQGVVDIGADERP